MKEHRTNFITRRYVADKLRSLREEEGLSRYELAKKLRITKNTYTNWEEGVSEPSLGNIIMLADFFGISLDKLVGREFKDGRSD